LLDGQGNVHVADFGIASAAGLESLTLTGTVLGTAGYLAPEQAQGERAGPASDLYALAVVAYELLSGHRPFENDSPTAEATAHVHAPVPSIAERCEHLPSTLDEVFGQALAKDPQARFGTAAELVAAIRAALSPPKPETWPGAEAPTTPIARPVRARRSRIPGGALLPVLLLLAAAGVGALVAALLTGGHNAVRVRTVVEPGGGTTTVHETVTQQQSSSAPPPPPPPAVSSGGHTLNDRGFALMQRGDYPGALPLLQQAVAKLQGTGPADPSEGYANYNLGYTLYQLGRCSEAIGYLQRAEQLEPDRHEPRKVLKRAERCK
jgi:tetratricopeptide (TPR) repeat protein